MEARYTTNESSSITFDSADDFAVSWESETSNDNIKGGTPNYDVFAQECQLYDSTGHVSGAVIRPTFRVNSATADTTTTISGPTARGRQVAMDADGDMTFSYDGFGPAVSDNNADDFDINGVITSGGTVSTYSQELLTFDYYAVGGAIYITPGNFELKIAGLSTTAPIYFDPTNPTTTAGNIQSALNRMLALAGSTAPSRSLTGARTPPAPSSPSR